MKILHTADVHIREKDDERWQALAHLLELGKAHQINVLVIAGDLFDSPGAAEMLRPSLRELFANCPFTTLLIPGNHDVDAFPEGVFLGEKVIIFRDIFTPVHHDGVSFWGFPYQDLDEAGVLEKLHLAAEKVSDAVVNVLIFHGELLDVIGGLGGYGEEGRRRYMPIRLSNFARLPWQYVLGGHFHSAFDVHEFRDDAYFVYPGSPVAITRREIGVRKANLQEIGHIPDPVELITPFFERITVQLDPFQKSNPLDQISREIKNASKSARVLLRVSGFFNGRVLKLTESDLHQAIEEIRDERIEMEEMTFRDIRELVEEDLFQLFLKRLNKSPFDARDRRDILTLALQAFTESR